MNVVVRTEDGAVSLLVDQIGDVVEVDEHTFEPPPETLVGRIRDVVEGVIRACGSPIVSTAADAAPTLDEVAA
jgi:purine-binding chemotaxis protein CheW